MTVTASEYRHYSRILRKISGVALVIALISLYSVFQFERPVSDIVGQSSDGRSEVVVQFGEIDSGTIQFWTLVISAATFVLALIAALSTGILGWRKDARDRKESELRNQKLALEIDNLKQAGEDQPGP